MNFQDAYKRATVAPCKFKPMFIIMWWTRLVLVVYEGVPFGKGLIKIAADNGPFCVLEIVRLVLFCNILCQTLLPV